MQNEADIGITKIYKEVLHKTNERKNKLKPAEMDLQSLSGHDSEGMRKRLNLYITFSTSLNRGV